MGFGVDYVIGSLGRNNIASKIANGHAFRKHSHEFGINSKGAFASMIQDIMKNPTETKIGSGGQRLYWSDKYGAFLSVNPNDKKGDFGTVFKPTDGKKYYDRQ
jgi:pyocin large subunit-like protein